MFFLGLLSKIIILAAFTYTWEYFRLFTIPFAWWSWVLIFFLDDFAYYWTYRIGHRSRFLWASHVVHHSSQEYNLSTALRQTWTGGFFTFVFWIWIAFLGFHPLMILTQMSISLIYQYWIHTELIKKCRNGLKQYSTHHRITELAMAQTRFIWIKTTSEF